MSRDPQFASCSFRSLPVLFQTQDHLAPAALGTQIRETTRIAVLVLSTSKPAEGREGLALCPNQGGQFQRKPFTRAWGWGGELTHGKASGCQSRWPHRCPLPRLALLKEVQVQSLSRACRPDRAVKVTLGGDSRTDTSSCR